MEESAIWTEKYRPKTFAELRGQKEIVEKISAFVNKSNMPHLLFAGPAGVGKSTLALVIARTLYGDSFRENFLELNSSDERGIDVVRNKVKDFARTKALGDVPFKVIFLDECDALTRDAQQALRRTMENYSKTCRFILAANYRSKIIDPIQSRCAVFSFRHLNDAEVVELIDTVVANENLQIDSGAKSALVRVAGGDCRRVVNLLQSCASISSSVTADTIHSLASIAHPDEVKAVLSTAMSGNFVKARKDLLDMMLKYGLSGMDACKQIQSEIWNLDVDNRAKVNLIDKCGETEFRIVEGSDEFIQLEALLAQFVLAGSK